MRACIEGYPGEYIQTRYATKGEDGGPWLGDMGARLATVYMLASVDVGPRNSRTYCGEPFLSFASPVENIPSIYI